LKTSGNEVKRMASFNEIDEARKLLGLGEAATLEEVKRAYRGLAKRHHPDKHGGIDRNRDEIMKRLNRAYGLIMDYCNEYKFSFRQEDVARVYQKEEEYRSWRDKWSDSI
jgi:DnaJ-class molecular chaperone